MNLKTITMKQEKVSFLSSNEIAKTVGALLLLLSPFISTLNISAQESNAKDICFENNPENLLTPAEIEKIKVAYKFPNIYQEIFSEIIPNLKSGCLLKGTEVQGIQTTLLELRHYEQILAEYSITNEKALDKKLDLKLRMEVHNLVLEAMRHKQDSPVFKNNGSKNEIDLLKILFSLSVISVSAYVIGRYWLIYLGTFILYGEAEANESMKDTFWYRMYRMFNNF